MAAAATAAAAVWAAATAAGGVNGGPVGAGVGLVVTGLPLWARRRLQHAPAAADQEGALKAPEAS